jgi:hypothetical protein
LDRIELELEQTQTHMTQKPMLRVEDGSSQKAKRKRLIYEISLFSGVLWLYNPGTRLMSAARCDYATSAVF